MFRMWGWRPCNGGGSGFASDAWWVWLPLAWEAIILLQPGLASLAQGGEVGLEPLHPPREVRPIAVRALWRDVTRHITDVADDGDHSILIVSLPHVCAASDWGSHLAFLGGGVALPDRFEWVRVSSHHVDCIKRHAHVLHRCNQRIILGSSA